MNDELYVFQHFEVREYSSNRFDSLFSNTIGHIRNCFLKVVNEHAALPKIIVVVLDDELVFEFEKYDDPELITHEITACAVERNGPSNIILQGHNSTNSAEA